MKLARVLPVLAAAGLAFGLCGPARADLDAYVATADGDFGWVDLATGVYHRIGSLDLPSGDTISGMGFIGGALVGGDSNFNGGSLYTINAATGAATQVGALNDGANAYTVIGGTTVGPAFVGVTQDASSTIFQASPTAPPNVTLPQPLGFEGDGLVAADASGSNIYIGGNNGTASDSLYVLNGSGLSDLGLLGANAYAGVLSGGTLYAADNDNNIDSYAVSPTSLSGILTTTALTGLAEDQIDAMVLSPTPLTAVPEPSTWALMLLGFAGVGYAAHRRSRNSRAAVA